MKTSEHYDNILLEIKRHYSKDEKFAILLEKIKELEYENGTLKSDIHEKNYIYEKKCEAHAKEKLHFKRSKDEHKRIIEALKEEVEFFRTLRREALRKEDEMLKQLLNAQK